MSEPETYTISDIVEAAASRRLLRVIGLCFLLMICDSYDVAALSFAAPVLLKEWGLKPADMGLVFSAGMLGLLAGSILFGWIGDRFGRKRAMIAGALGFGLFTVATGLAESETSLLVLRFIATIGLGGAVPNAVALTTELTPKARRITAVGLIFAGYSVGGIIAGLSAAYIIGTMGWRAMFFIGGALSLAVSVAFVKVPESLAFLAAIPQRRAEALRVAAFLRPDCTFAAGAQVVADVAAGAPRAGLAELFAGRLAVATPLLWIIYIANSMTVFSLSSWMPVAVESVGLSRGMAAVATALLYVGSAVGGVIGGRFADRFGIVAVTVMAALAIPSIGVLGALGGQGGLLLVLCVLAGAFCFGGQTCLHGVAGTLYPTNVRANGVGWAIGIAKIGSIAGPFIVGLLMAHLTGAQLFLAAAAPLVLVVVLSLALRTLAREPART
jgi:MFS transporter, AAHS family, 4-hydroxybenzoate transporter